MTNREQGFTLIELMIVVAIVAVLSAIALPVYRGHIARSADNACLGEAKAYAHQVLAAHANEWTPTAHTPGRCNLIATPAITDATFTATPLAPGTGTVTCDLFNGGSCHL